MRFSAFDTVTGHREQSMPGTSRVIRAGSAACAPPIASAMRLAKKVSRIVGREYEKVSNYECDPEGNALPLTYIRARTSRLRAALRRTEIEPIERKTERGDRNRDKDRKKSLQIAKLRDPSAAKTN